MLLRIICALFIALISFFVQYTVLKGTFGAIYNILVKPFSNNSNASIAPLKVYVYELPVKLLQKDFEMNLETCPNSFYNVEIIFPELIRTSKWHLQNVTETKDALAADYFLVPHYSSCYYHKCLQTKTSAHECRTYVTNYMANILDYVENEYPYWQRRRGADHLFVLCWDWGVHLFGEVNESITRNRLAGSIHLTLLGMDDPAKRLIFDTRKDISIPPWRDYSVLKFSPHPPMRSIFAYFRGTIEPAKGEGVGYSKGIREKIVKLAEEEPTKYYVRSQHNDFYWHELLNARFVLCPPGWSHWSARFFDAIIAGAIPVLISDEWIPAFNATIPYEQFIVRVEEKDIEKLTSILTSIGVEEEKKMRQGLQQIAHHFIYNNPSIPDDALDTTMNILAQRPLPAPIKPIISIGYTDNEQTHDEDQSPSFDQEGGNSFGEL